MDISDKKELVKDLRECIEDNLLYEERTSEIKYINHVSELLIENGYSRVSGEYNMRIGTLNYVGEVLEKSYILLVNEDMSFLLETLLVIVERSGQSVSRIFHPVIDVERDESGILQRLLVRGGTEKVTSEETTIRESYILLEINGLLSKESEEELGRGIELSMRDLIVLHKDKTNMYDRYREIREESLKDDVEVGKYLDWLMETGFTIFGMRQLLYEESHAGIEIKSRAGIVLNNEGLLFRGRFSSESAEETKREMLQEARRVRYYKANIRSLIGKYAHLDVISIYFRSGAGKLREEQIIGSLGGQSYTEDIRKIPFYGKKLEEVRKGIDLKNSDYNLRVFNETLSSYPLEEIFLASNQDLEDGIRNAYFAHLHKQLGLVWRQDPLGRYISAIIYIPRRKVYKDLHKQFEKKLQEYCGGELRAYTEHIESADQSGMFRMQFIFLISERKVLDIKQLEGELSLLSRSWEDKFSEQLSVQVEPTLARKLYQRYSNTLSSEYKDDNNSVEGVLDVLFLEELEKDGEGVKFRVEALEGGELLVKSYMSGGGAELHKMVGILSSMDMVLKASKSYILDLPCGKTTIQEYRVASGQKDIKKKLNKEWGHRVEECLEKIVKGETELDGFNSLVLKLGISWRESILLRAYGLYMKQIRIAASGRSIWTTLSNNGEIVNKLLELFKLRFDVGSGLDKEDRLLRGREISEEIELLLNGVEDLLEDTILRKYLNIINVTLRTNYYKSELGYISFKISSRELADIPKPAPYCEIYVYSVRFEAVHLRFTKVSRGGLRWSDRIDDFRTEILGLVKAQQVKNGVIVPMGAKGGFVLKGVYRDRDSRQREGIECYKLFIGALLELTDNYKGRDVEEASGIVRLDDNDPYLVVAADKGTATFSDIANEIAEERGFWLGDAFASGGAYGYDHKKMGITAKGGWKAVQRHFMELGKDIQKEEFRVIGIGDMSGDVFGNGMLLSEKIKLVCAFNHQHIFLDPDPETSVSFKERLRLFAKERSSWADYDRTLLSSGGGIFERSVKSIELSKEVREMLGSEESSLSPNNLIRKILQSETDLLWFGGIGTYIKGKEESHGDVGDRANDLIRIDSDELHCKVIGEGANLGITQRGRIGYSLLGGRCNTDAIDNSAGVDCSDHEVNIKIALSAAQEQEGLTLEGRNELLEEMEEDTSRLVLWNNYQQTQSISIAEHNAAAEINGYQAMIKEFEREGFLDRELEFLPSDEEFDERKKQGLGLVRAELAVLLAYVKNWTSEHLSNSNFSDDSFLRADLHRYFPSELSKRYAGCIDGHRLRREIISTYVLNSMINRAGILFAMRMRDESSRSVEDITRAYIIIREVLDLRDIWVETELLDHKVRAEEQAKVFIETHRSINRMVSWLLHNEKELPIESLIDKYKVIVDNFRKNSGKLLSAETREELERRINRFKEGGIGEGLASKVGVLKYISSSFDIGWIQSKLPDINIEDSIRNYFLLGEELHLNWLRTNVNSLRLRSRWGQGVQQIVIDGLWDIQRNLLLRASEGGKSGEDILASLTETYGERLQDILEKIEDIKHQNTYELSMFIILEKDLRELCGSS